MRANVFLMLILPILGCVGSVYAQPFKFAHVTDTHVGGATGAADLRNAVRDINAHTDLDFVIISGDITEFGADDELKLAKQILDSLQRPYYIIPGNHDANWSESGGNSFREVFGSETFYFSHHGYRFVGTNSGPNMRMSPGQIPRENIVWLDSVLNLDRNLPLIYINHYPQDSSLNNWYEAIDRIKEQDIRLILCGHGHINRHYDFEGIPGIMGRSNLRAKSNVGGYNMVTFTSTRATFQERIPDSLTDAAWESIPLENHYFSKDTATFPRPDYRINDRYPRIKAKWVFEDKSDIGVGAAYGKGKIITGNTNGEVYALDRKSGKLAWSYRTNGKIYSTPAIWHGVVVVGSSDNAIYGINLRNGKLKWKVDAQKAVLGSPEIVDGVAYIGASDGVFRAIDVSSGKVIWSFDEVKGYVSSKPLFYHNTLYFGSWGNGFYALDAMTGKKKWEWDNGASNRMFSPAACYPIATGGKVFIVAPDRFMTALDAENGAVIWRKKMNEYRVRESIGLSADSSLVYAKTMDGQLIGISTSASDMVVAWESKLQLPYELAPTALLEHEGLVFVPSHSGLLSAVNRETGEVVWQHKISNCLINPMLPLKSKKQMVVSTMDGKVVNLNY